MPISFNMKTHLITGRGCIAQNSAALAALGQRCLVLTGKSAAKRCGALDAVTEVLTGAGISFTVYDGIAPNPTVLSALAAGRAAADSGADFLIGIGGGSVLDAAKVAGIAAGNPAMDEAGYYSRVWEKPGKPVVLVGTTAGTGSEVTSVAVLTDSAHRKHSVHDERLYARYAFGDPTFTMSAPPAVTASTGIDVLSHCAESYFSRKADSLTRIFAVNGAREFLEVAAETEGFSTPLSYAQRERLYEASLLAGLAINTTGTVFAHTFGYVLTERFGIPHGFASAVFLPELLQGAEAAEPELAAAFYAATGFSGEALLGLCAKLLPELTVTLTPEEIEAILPRFDGNGSVNNTIFTVTQDRAREIFLQRFSGREAQL